MPGLCADFEAVERGLEPFDLKGFFGRGDVEMGLCGSEAVGSGEIWQAADGSPMDWESALETSSSFSPEMEAGFRESFRRLGPFCLVREKIDSSAALES